MGITPNNGPTMGGTTVAISCTGDSTAKTFFTAKTAHRPDVLRVSVQLGKNSF